MWHSCTIEETIRNLRTNIHRGLSKEEVISRMNKYRSKWAKKKEKRELIY